MAKRATKKADPAHEAETIERVVDDVREEETAKAPRCEVCGGLPEDHVGGMFTDGVCYLRCTCDPANAARGTHHCPQHDDAYRRGAERDEETQ